MPNCLIENNIIERFDFIMNIISGLARNLELASLPDCGIRPTSARARKALFDSLGNFSGKTILDLFSGSGALALESASRGAAKIFMVEREIDHIQCIRENCRRVSAAGVDCEMTILEFDALQPERYLNKLTAIPDIIFADPPYAESGKYFRQLMDDHHFCETLSSCRIIWEIPDTPGAMADFLECNSLTGNSFRRFGSTFFLSGNIK